MELKPPAILFASAVTLVLIVPSGIETKFWLVKSVSAKIVLIVPSGIETDVARFFTLIVYVY